MTKVSELENGEVYIGFVRYVEDIDNDINPRGKLRPVVIFQDPEENQFFACKVSGRIDKPLEIKNGYIIQDWQEAGLKKPSIVACNKENIREIEKTDVHDYVGRLTDRDIKGMLVKRIKMSKLEYKKELEKNDGLER